LKEPDITLSNLIVADKVAQIKVAPTCIRQARWPDSEFAFPNIVLRRNSEYDICIFAWKVLECIILAYHLIKKATECDSDMVKLVLPIAEVLIRE
jgi:hypothetical protein